VSRPDSETTERIRRHVECLAGGIGERNVFRPAALSAAREYIAAEWRQQGYQVCQQWYEVAGQSCANLEAARPGSTWPKQILVVGAHYDTVRGSPGADDNASGVAALLEISRLFAVVVPRVAVRFVAFVNEEAPFFLSGQQGSMIYARRARAQNDDIRLMLSLEMLGYYSAAPGSQRYPPLFRLLYPDRGYFIGLVSDFRSRSMMLRIARLLRAHSAFPLEHVATFRSVPGVSWSDHRSFWACGYRALMVTDTAFYRNPHYHRADDTPDTLAYPQLAEVTEGLFLSLADLAQSGFDAT
jgi:Zn-dependent M28 family amino/carboxypeptidase